MTLFALCFQYFSKAEDGNPYHRLPALVRPYELINYIWMKLIHLFIFYNREKSKIKS